MISGVYLAYTTVVATRKQRYGKVPDRLEEDRAQPGGSFTRLGRPTAFRCSKVDKSESETQSGDLPC